MSERTKCPVCLGYGTDGMETTYVALLGMYQTTHVPCPRCDGREIVDTPQCAIKGCEENAAYTCVCCHRRVCFCDISGADDLGPGICVQCLRECAGGIACKVEVQP